MRNKEITSLFKSIFKILQSIRCNFYRRTVNFRKMAVLIVKFKEN